MAALSIPEQHGIVSPSSFAAALSTAPMAKNTVTEDVGGQNAQLGAFTHPKNAQDETLEQSKVADEPLTTADPLESASHSTGVPPTIGAFTVQCAKCMKWRFIPTKAQYEAIRHSIVQRPFLCSSASEWRPHASCEDPFEISPDLHELWAFDKPGIPLPPSGWERLLVIRPAGSAKFADIYYITPSGKRLRSMPEIERFLSEHPEYVHPGLKLSQFSFIVPRPLDRDYCRKKNDSLTFGEKGIPPQKKSHSKSTPVDAHLSKLGIVQPLFKVVSSKPKLEKLKFRKKADLESNPGGEPQPLHSEERSFDNLAIQQGMKSPLTSQELAIKIEGDGVIATAGSSEIV